MLAWTHPEETCMRSLHRTFNNRTFEEGGRLHGGFWLGIKKTERRYLRIDGEPVAELDFGQMRLRLLYARARVQPEGEDLYDIPCRGYTRDGVKGLINAAISASKRQTRMPKEMRDHFEGDMTYAAAIKAIEDRHRPIKHLFFKGLGLKLQAQEAEIMIELLLALRDKGIMSKPMASAPMASATVGSRAHPARTRTFW